MILPVRATAHLQTSQRLLLLYEGNNNIVNNLYKTRWCTRECAPISSVPTPRRICWAGSELSVSLPRWSLTALWTGTALFTTRSYTLNIKHLLHDCTRWPFFLLHLWSLQALLQLSGFHTDRWQHRIGGLPWIPVWWRGSLPKAQAHQQDSEWTESAHRWEDGDVAVRAQGEAEYASETQQVVKAHTVFKSQWFT